MGVGVNMRPRNNISHIRSKTVRWPSECSYGRGDCIEYGGGLDGIEGLDSLSMMITSFSGKLSSVGFTATGLLRARPTVANLMA